MVKFLLKEFFNSVITRVRLFIKITEIFSNENIKYYFIKTATQKAIVDQKGNITKEILKN
jgi:AAA+ superfamily predicted ATPase